MSLWSRVEVEHFEDVLGPDVRHVRVYDPSREAQRGFGSATSDELAMMKAVSEFCERATMLEQKQIGTEINSNGFAVHRSVEAASESALAELIERDLVLCSWFAKRSPVWLSKLPSEWSVFENAEINARVGLLGINEGVYVYTSILMPRHSEQFGFLYASAASKNPEQAIETLYLNQRRNLTYTRQNAHREESAKDAVIDKPGKHRDYYLNHAKRFAWEWMLNGSAEPLHMETKPILVEPLLIPFETPWPLFAARASSVKLQPYFVGPTELSKINVRRLAEYGLTDLSTLNCELHPLP